MEKYLIDNKNEQIDSEINPNVDQVSDQEVIKTILLQQTKVYKYRFFILIMFCFLNFSSGMQWVTYSSIATNFRKSFDLTEIKVDLLSLCFMIVYPIMTLPCSYIIDSISLRLGLILASLLTILASVSKIFTTDSLAFAYIGQILAGIGQPFILNSPGKLASTWFKPEHRVLVTSIAALSNTFGIIFGFLLSTFFYPNQSEISNFKSTLPSYLITECIITAVLCAPTLIFMKNKPKLPPSLSQKEHQTPNFKESLKLLFTNRNFNFLLIAFSFIIGFFNLVGTKINEIASSYKIITQDEISDSVAIATVGGIIGSIVMSIVVDKLKRYKRVFIILCAIGLASLTGLTILLQFIKNQAVFFAIFTIFLTAIEFSVVPIFTISFDLVIELTYPVGESVSGGIIMTSNQITGIIIILIDDYITNNFKGKTWVTFTICIGMIFIAFLSLAFLKEKLLRQKKDLVKPLYPFSDSN